MPALFVDDLAARVELACSGRCVEVDVLDADGTAPLCEVMVAGQIVSGLYDSVRRTLVAFPPSSKLADQPGSVSALVCPSMFSPGGAAGYTVLLAAENGATVLLPREGATNASEIRVRPRGTNGQPSGLNGSVVALANGADPYATLLHASRLLADKTGAELKDVSAYVLPLLDAVNRMRFGAPLVKAKSSGKASSTLSLTAVLEQQLHEGILVQAGPNCPAKPLLQSPGLRLCQGMAAPLGVRYSGMSVVFGTATGHVLAVMDTAAALKMAPAGGIRPLAPTSSGRWLSGDEGSPSAVSAGVSAATSTSPSPTMSRSNSSNGDALMVVNTTATPLASCPNALAANPRTPSRVGLSGRSITTSPIIQVFAAAPSAGVPPGHTVTATPTPTGAPTHVLASFAPLGVKTSAGRLGAVECCRIMPASAVRPAGEATAARALGGGLGLIVQVEVSCASAGTLLLFVEGPDIELSSDPHREDLAAWEVAAAAGSVRGVMAQGCEACWRYNSTGGILSVELEPATNAPQRKVQVFL